MTKYQIGDLIKLTSEFETDSREIPSGTMGVIVKCLQPVDEITYVKVCFISQEEFKCNNTYYINSEDIKILSLKSVSDNLVAVRWYFNVICNLLEFEPELGRKVSKEIKARVDQSLACLLKRYLCR